jgi:N-acetylneuraminic acid mutarotase
MQIIQIFVFLLSTNSAESWSGIVTDGWFGGNTQLYVPGNPPINTPNVDFGLSHLNRQAAVMLNGRAYFIGGCCSRTNAVTIFNPSTNTSTNGVPLNVARDGHMATVVGDTIIVCGGFNSGYLALCEQYNPTTQKWNMITSLPTPSAFFTMATLNNHAYTFGGSETRCGSAPTVYMFDGQNWVSRASFVGLPYWSNAGVVLDADRALICGGFPYRGGLCNTSVSDCHIYSASSDSWTQAAPMAQIRCYHSMVMFEGKRSKTVLKSCNNKITGQIYIFGGSCGSSTTVELYSPTTGGQILPTNIVGDNSMAAVSIGKSNVTNLCKESYTRTLN